MNKFDNDMGLVGLMCLLVFIWGGFATLVIGVNMFRCDRQWSDSGVSSRYKVFVGCQLQRKDGTWYPASAYREPGK